MWGGIAVFYASCYCYSRPYKPDIGWARFDANRENGKQKDHIYGKILAVAVYLLNWTEFICQSVIPKDDLTLKTTMFSAKVRVKTDTFIAWKSRATPSEASAGPRERLT